MEPNGEDIYIEEDIEEDIDPSERDWVKADELYDEIKSGYIDKEDIE